jgi:hypothetical protein
MNSEESQTIIEKLQREKELLKHLLKAEMAKSASACNHLKNILEFLQTAVGIGMVRGDSLRMTTGGLDFSVGKKLSMDHLDIGRNSLSASSPSLSVVKESRF